MQQLCPSAPCGLRAHRLPASLMGSLHLRALPCKGKNTDSYAAAVFKDRGHQQGYQAQKSSEELQKDGFHALLAVSLLTLNHLRSAVLAARNKPTVQIDGKHFDSTCRFLSGGML